VIAQERIQRLERSVTQLIQEIERLPTEVLYRPPSQGEWPVMSTLAHLAELLPYWAHQAEGIAAQPGKPFGRTHADADRLGAIEQHGHDSLDMAVKRIRAGLQECVTVLSALPAEAWASAGQHPSRGMMTIEQVVDAFLVHHAEEHTAQTHATLETLQTNSPRPL
jgi:uncharacterized damage-inducible protein DinB